jgi:acetyl esterase
MTDSQDIDVDVATQRRFQEVLAEVSASRATVTTVADLRVEAARASERVLPLVLDELPEVGAFHEAVLIREVDGLEVTADIVQPVGAGPHPVLVYLHGGGFVMGSARNDCSVAYRFASEGFLTFSIDYRLAPESPFPAAFDDCLHAVNWAAERAQDYDGKGDCVALAGCSAGANLAAAVAVHLHNAPAPRVVAALLLYGAGDVIAPEQPPEARTMFGAMMEAYLGGLDPEELTTDPRLCPLTLADKLPPSYVAVGTLDPFVPACERISAALDRAGTPHVFEVLDGLPHGFLPYYRFLPPVDALVDRMTLFVRQHLERLALGQTTTSMERAPGQ